jgi:hypothetical protein
MGLWLALVLLTVGATRTNLTLYHFYPSHMRDRSPTGIADFWLADPYNVAFYFLRTRMSNLACLVEPTSFYCQAINETLPYSQFLYEQLVVEVDLNAFPEDEFNFGWGNYSTCALPNEDYRANYTCQCTLFLRCNGLANTRGRVAAHGFSTYGKDAPFGDWYSLLAQRGQHECVGPSPPPCCHKETCQGVKNIPDNPLNAYWYNTMRAGGCVGGVISPDCTWRVVETVKTTNATCHNAQIDANVETLASSCLSRSGCRSDIKCYTTCYMEALLGVNATSPSQGLTADAITAIFTKPFKSEDPNLGGCPNIP